MGLDIIDLIVSPRRSLAILVMAVSPIAAVLAWLDSDGWKALGATGLFAGAAIFAIAAIPPGWRAGLLRLVPSIGLFAGGVLLGFGS
jgi:hypothetical protein